MAIRLTYTPYEAIGQAAVQAGEAEARIRDQEYQRRLSLTAMQHQQAMARMGFQAEIDEAKQQKYFMMQSELINQKQQMAMAMELQQFQQNRAKLLSTLNLIDSADYLSEREKEIAKTTAYSRWADADVPASIFNMDATMTQPMDFSDAAKLQGNLSTTMARYQDMYDQKYYVNKDNELRVKYKKGDKLESREPTAQEIREAQFLQRQMQTLSSQIQQMSQTPGAGLSQPLSSEGERGRPAETALQLEQIFNEHPDLRTAWEIARQQGASPQEFLNHIQTQLAASQ